MLAFLFIFERKYLRNCVAEVRISEQNSKGMLAFLFIFERKYFRNYVAEVRISEEREY